MPAPTADVDMGRHVHIVRETGLQRAQSFCRYVRALRIRRGLDGMDVEMVREGMAVPGV